jgi:hypothetical protein
VWGGFALPFCCGKTVKAGPGALWLGRLGLGKAVEAGRVVETHGQARLGGHSF